MTNAEPVRLTFRGGHVGLRILVKDLEEQGLRVEYDPPMEYRHGELAGAAVTVALAAFGGALGNLGSDAVKAAARRGVQAFRSRMREAPPERASEVQIEDDD